VIEPLLSRFAWVGGHADVWRWFDEPDLLRAIASALVDPFRDRATKIAGIESRGFILGTACALELDGGFVPIRKGHGPASGPEGRPGDLGGLPRRSADPPTSARGPE
jgi:adenine phosphoribosyltransferase